MIILALDSALEASSAALVATDRVLARRVAPGAKGQAEKLVPLVEAVREEAGIAWASIDRIAVTVGPGSFTGIRVGLAAAKGFGLAAARPVIGVTTLEALAHPWRGAPLLVAIEAGRGEVFHQLFDAMGAPMNEASAGPLSRLDAAPGTRVVGGAAAALVALRPHLALVDAPSWPDPEAIAAIGAARIPLADGAMPAPLYIHPPRLKVPAAS